MTPPSPRSMHLHIDRRRMLTLATAGAFLVIAIVFGALAYFQGPPQAKVGHVSVPVTATTQITVTPAASPAGTGTPAAPTAVVVTVTSTKIIGVPQASSGSSLDTIETGASTLATVVAAACAVIALRPQGRARPPAPPAPAAAADAPASTPGA